jgi:hypothetical protein
MSRSHRVRRTAVVLVTAAVAVTSGCQSDANDKQLSRGIALETRGLASNCNLGESFDCGGGGRPNAAPGPEGLVLVVWDGAYAPTRRGSWGRLIDAHARRPVGELLMLDLEPAEPGESLLLAGDERGWTVQLRGSAVRVSPDGSQRPARRKPGMDVDPAVTIIGPGCGGGAISVDVGDGGPLIVSAGEDRRMRIDPGVCGL